MFGSNIVGFVVMNGRQNNEEEAKQALVFMVSCLEGKTMTSPLQ